MIRAALVACWLLLLAAGAAHAIDKEIAFDDAAMNERYLALTREIRCPKCLNESIADSSAPVAADLRREVRRLMSEGKSDDEIKEFMSSRYGEFVLYRPPFNPVTWALYAAPFVFLAGGSLVFWRVLRARKSQSLDDDDDEPLDEDALT